MDDGQHPTLDEDGYQALAYRRPVGYKTLTPDV